MTDNSLNVRMASKALYSSWCYHQGYNTLFDCGEGCATSLANALPGVDLLFFSHGHGDHTLGLPSLVGCRNAAQGTSRNKETMADHNKPLTIYYPKDNDLFDDLFSFCEKRYAHWLRYKLNIVSIEPGFELQIGKNTYVRAIELRHQKSATTLGYVIYELRTRLKEKFRGQDIPALIRAHGYRPNDLSETYRANIFAYCLDAYEIVNPDEITGCANVVMDCTFLKKEDRTDMTHFTLDEAISVCKDVGVKHILAAHLSSRYKVDEYVFHLSSNYDVAKSYADDYVYIINPHRAENL